MFSHGCVRQIQRSISKNNILVPFMYAYCSNYPYLFVCDWPSINIVLQDAETVYPFSVALYTIKLILCNVFIGLSSIVALCLVLTLSLNYRSSFSLRFFYFSSCNKWENVHSALNPLKNTSVDWMSHNVWCFSQDVSFCPHPITQLVLSKACYILCF